METILLGTDGGEYAHRAAERTIELAMEKNARLYVICAVDKRKFDEPSLSSEELATIYAEDHAATFVEEVTKMAAEHDLKVEGVSRHGIPHELILEYADEVDADVIVLGRYGDHTEHISGVRRKVTELADREVIVVGR